MQKLFKLLSTIILAGTLISVPLASIQPVQAASSLQIVKVKNNKATKHKKSKKTKKQKSKSKATSYRWSKPAAKVYIGISDDPMLTAAVDEAIDAWNATQAFTFTVVKTKKKANITINTTDNPDTDAAGETKTYWLPSKNRLTKAKILLNVFYLENFAYNYHHDRIVNTAEHELGHAIGLNHTQKVSVMYPSGSFFTIQDCDIAAVKKLYKEK